MDAKQVYVNVKLHGLLSHVQRIPKVNVIVYWMDFGSSSPPKNVSVSIPNPCATKCKWQIS